MKRVQAAIAIIARGPEILICQRRTDGLLGGYWEFPGGKREKGETLEQCLHREVGEEVGIEIEPLVALPVIEHEYPHAHVRLHPFLCAYRNGEARPIHCQDIRWVAPSDLRQYRFPPANDSLIEGIIRRFAATAE